MFCKKCGKQLPDNMGSSPFCGAYLAERNAPQQQGYGYTAHYTVKPNKRGNAGLIAIIVILAILLLGAVSAIIIMAVTSNDGNSEKPLINIEDINKPTEGEALPESPEVSDETVVTDVPDAPEVPFTPGVPDTPYTPEMPDTPDVPFTPDVPDEPEADASVHPIAEHFLKRCEDTESWARAYGEVCVTQHDINKASGEIYAAWDDILNEVYTYLQDTMLSDEFEELKTDEIEWIKEKEAAVEAEGRNWEGGSGAPMAKNMVATDYTKERCYYLISLIK